jgi:hypothetical protein
MDGSLYMKLTLDWKVNNVRPKKTPRVISLESVIREKKRGHCNQI